MKAHNVCIHLCCKVRLTPSPCKTMNLYHTIGSIGKLEATQGLQAKEMMHPGVGSHAVPVVHKSHGPCCGNGCSPQTSTISSIHDTQPTCSAICELGIVQSQREGTPSGPGKVVGICKVFTETACTLVVLACSIECCLQKMMQELTSAEF